MGIKSRVIENVIDLALNEAVCNESFGELVDMEVSQQLDVFKLINKAFKNVFFYQVNNKVPVTLPYIGKLRIKDINRIALKYKNELAKEIGYNNYDDVPKDKLTNLNKIIKDKTINEYVEFKLQKSANLKIKKVKLKKKHNTGKIFTFNIKDILK